MMTALKAVLAVGTLAVFVAACGGEANAVPLVSSWYGPGFEGTTTASGEIYRADARTAAHPSLPFGTKSFVTYGERQTVVGVTDRGPYAGDRGLDLFQAAKEVGLNAVGAMR